MKKSWMFLLLTPLMSLSAAYPIYDEEYDLNYDIEEQDEAVSSSTYADEWQQQQDDSIAYEDEAQEEEVLAAPQKRSRSQENSPSAKKKQSTAPAKRSSAKTGRSVQGNTSARSKLRDARENTNRPRVTHRGKESSNYPNAGQIEADAQMEEPAYDEPSEPARNSSSKARKAPAASEKKTGQMERRSSANQRSVKAKSYRKSLKKVEKTTKPHPGKRPMGE